MNLSLITQIVYDDVDIRVIWQRGNTNLLLITFGDLTTPAKGHHYFSDVSARKAGVAALGMMAKRGNWYPQKSLERAYEKIRPLIENYNIRIAYGGSMGGYAAIKFSRLFGATHVIALCPQWSIDKAECEGNDPGWQTYFHLGMRGMGIRAEDVAGRVFLFADGFNPREMFHCRKIIEASPGAQYINVPLVSPHVTSLFADVSLIQLLNACLTFNLNELHQISRATRKNTRIWRAGVIDAALQRWPRIGFRALLKYSRQDVDYLRPHKPYTLAILDRIMQTDGIQEAIEFYNECRHQLNPMDQLKSCAQLTRMAGVYLMIETTHGTTLVYDLKENRCSHKSTCEEGAESRVEIEMLGRFAALFIRIGEMKFYLTIDAIATLAIPDMDNSQRHPFNFEIDGAPNGLFSVKFAGSYLCAQKDGVAVCNRNSADAWEHFMIGVGLKPPIPPDQHGEIGSPHDEAAAVAESA